MTLQSRRIKFLAVWLVLVLPMLACGLSPSHLELAREAAEEGEPETAVAEYTLALQEDDLDPADQFAARTERAALYQQQEKLDDALADYDAALALTTEEGEPAGNHTPIYLARAEIYVAQENWPAIVENLDTVLTEQPNNYEALARRGYAHLQLRNFDQAIADLKASLQGDVEAATTDLDSRQNLISAYYDLALAMRDLGEFEEAIEYNNEALALAEDTDDRAEILASRGFDYSELGENEKAMADLDQAIALKPDMALAYAYRSYIYGDENQYEAAIADASKAVELGQNLSDTRMSSIVHARALAYLYTEQYDLAAQDATEAIRLAGSDDSGSARTYNIRSQANRNLGDYQQAIADAGKAIELGSTDIVALSGFYRSRALAHYYNDDPANALEDMDAVVSLEEDSPSANNFDIIGLIHYEQENYDAALENYQQALALAPDNGWLHNSIGDVYYQIDDLGSAETSYRSAIRLEPEVALFYENLGLVQRLTERYEEAAENYSAALSLDEQRPFSWLGRGVAHYHLGQNAEAVSDLETVLTFEVSPQVIDFTQEYLTDLGQ